MYTDDDEIGRAVAADLEECWQGEGWYRICFTDGMGSYPAMENAGLRCQPNT